LSASLSAATATTQAGISTDQANLAKDWATKTSAEVVVGEGYGAKKYANDAKASETIATTKATEASASALKSSSWADTGFNQEVEAGRYSAKHWALQAQASVTGTLVYRGSFNAAPGVYPSSPLLGDYYKITTAGILGGLAHAPGDSIIYNGTDWDKIDSTDAVTSVAGRVGNVVLTKADVGLDSVDNTSDANKPISTATQTALNAKVDKVAGKQLSTEDYTTAEKSKLSGVAAGANNYSHPEGDGNWHVPATGTTNNGKVLKAGSTAGSAAWGNVDYSEVTNRPTLGTAASRDVADLLAKMPVNISGATTDFNSLTLSGLYNLYNTQSATGAPPFSYGVMFVIGSNRAGSTFAAQIAIDKSTGDTYTRGQNDTSTNWSAWQKGWNSNNDGAGSGLDSDLLDGQHGSFYQNASNLTAGTVPEPRIPALPISKITDLQTALNGKQAALGFTPIQQGGPAGYGTSKVYIGWANDGSGLLCQVDATNFGKSWPINVTGTAATVANHYVSSAVQQTGDIGAAFTDWSTTAAAAVQINTPNSSAAYMVWRATRWGARHVAAMHVYEGSMTVTMSVGNLNNFIWDGNGNFTATGNVNALSDIRLKTDLTKIEGALGKVCAINGYTYTRKDTGARQTGVVAQEVQKVLPEAVMENGENLAVAYGNMVGLLIEAIKELKAEVDQLKGK
jgi:hypothetical protein